ncbi:type IV pilus assembly protein PilO [Bacillus oleivorans]|uniref:Type IV pilus assembly protein PilO n=1 Tax=Bacillus oleivorans TaxID=1448271 RepID=A0A285CVJ6_9BACI|nr:type 4a pilus biogenesis protein PilO [Bacillus oleivorans]SNX71554.1 type IV pilus assembly protein PilO [Bacillus oleivorans]
MKAIKFIRVILFTFFIFGLLLISGYQFVVLPLQASIETLEQQIKEETDLFQSVSEGDQQEVNDDKLRINELQKQLPPQPLVDQLILDLEKAELASDSLILNITFGDSSVEESPSDTETNVSEEEQDQTVPQSPAIPSDVEKVTISMSVQSPTYEDLEEFLEELENMKRIIQIENLTFSGQGDLSSQGNQTPVVFTIQISAFYYPNGEITNL